MVRACRCTATVLRYVDKCRLFVSNFFFFDVRQTDLAPRGNGDYQYDNCVLNDWVDMFPSFVSVTGG